eukprot:TRINITY_DN3239_c0_g1_i1.p2 TRINITY_DN3239_c0_g1~~TRINITY_DN3239_c0_g1_i1.p2  ORF type:complete len:209 (+),score=47.41 TRINITY_DN3239_c0_g1_i1:138-764(+)
MFRKIEDLGNINQANKSFTKTARKLLCDNYPILNDYIDEILPKKAMLKTTKVRPENKIELVIDETDEIIFYTKDKLVVPTLRLLHRYPDMLPKMQVDKGAIKHVFGGANVMCPGLTSAGGKMDDVPSGAVVAITAEGKKHAVAIGVTTLSTKDIAGHGKGIGIETTHHLNDALWHLRDVKALKDANKEQRIETIIIHCIHMHLSLIHI